MENLLCDDLGRLITLTKDDKNMQRLRGVECLKANIQVINEIADFVSTSLGPNGMDKILRSPDGMVTITNDGATILKEMEMTESPIAQFILELSEAQDEEIGDGTTSVVILASAMLKNTLELIEKGIHPVKIAEGYVKSCDAVVKHLEAISEEIEEENIKKYLFDAAKTSLNSKIVNKCVDHFSNICVEAVCSVFDKDRNDIDFELIKIDSKIGSDLNKTEMINGVIIHKEMSHHQMKKEIQDGKIAILTCPFEPPKIKTKHNLNIKSVEDYKNLEQYEKSKFIEMINFVKNVGTDLVICQWGFDDEANGLLMENDLPAIRWVGGGEIEQIAVHTNTNIISRFEDLTEKDLGTADVKEISLGTENEKIIVLKNNQDKKTVTIFVRGGTKIVIEEAKRAIRDALCAVRNMLVEKRIVYGGGASDLSSSIYLQELANNIKGEERECYAAFSKALEEIPFCLAKNNGLNPINALCGTKLRQINDKNHFIGIDTDSENGADMKEKHVFDSLKCKTKQITMATQLVNMILKIDDIIIGTDDE
ncbi:T-complex protein 1 subunit epsilon [Binucleata daphniae]